MNGAPTRRSTTLRLVGRANRRKPFHLPESPETWKWTEPLWNSVRVPPLRRLSKVGRWWLRRDWERNWGTLPKV